MAAIRSNAGKQLLAYSTYAHCRLMWLKRAAVTSSTELSRWLTVFRSAASRTAAAADFRRSLTTEK